MAHFPRRPLAVDTRSADGHSRDGHSDESAQLIPHAYRPARNTPTTGSRRFSRSSSMYSMGDSKYPSTASLADRNPTFVPLFGAGGIVISSKGYDPAELNHGREADDHLHDPDPVGYREKRSAASLRGCGNVFTLLLVIAMIVGLFLVYPVTDFILSGGLRTLMAGTHRVNSTGQAAVLATVPVLVDPDTPLDVRSRQGFDGAEYTLVFSDEFNVDGRSFYPGDDPFWEAQDLWYGATLDREWYDPEMIQTEGGSLRVNIDKVDANLNHNLTLKSGMLTTWNKFCFTSGYIEARVQLPGLPKTSGYWPGVWLLGNLGRPGYAASTDGTWPYGYDSCDVGVMPAQVDADGPPLAANPLPPPSQGGHGDSRYQYMLSALPGQRLSACTCPGEDHPGPWLESEGRWRGRGAPEIDVIEAQKCKHRGELADQCVSQSAQFAPFDYDYEFNPAGVSIESPLKTERNQFHGSPMQQSVSCISNVTDSTMRDGPGGGGYGVFGFEFFADPTDPSKSYVSWVSDGERSHTVYGTSVGPSETIRIGQRLIAPEPMAIILNLGVADSFQKVDEVAMTYPNGMSVDYVRVYQRKGTGENGYTCDPPDYPTTKYIQDHLEAYSDINATAWTSFYPQPKNRWANPGFC